MSFRIVNTRLNWLADKDRPAAGEALVIPANDQLWMLSGPGLDVKKSAGKEIEIEAVRHGPVAPGQIVATPGGACGFTHLVHAVVMGQDFRWIPGAGSDAVRALLRWAASAKVSALVVHPLYRGVQTRREEPAREMLAGLVSGLQEASSLKTVEVMFADPQERGLLQDTVVRLLSEGA